MFLQDLFENNGLRPINFMLNQHDSKLAALKHKSYEVSNFLLNSSIPEAIKDEADSLFTDLKIKYNELLNREQDTIIRRLTKFFKTIYPHCSEAIDAFKFNSIRTNIDFKGDAFYSNTHHTGLSIEGILDRSLILFIKQIIPEVEQFSSAKRNIVSSLPVFTLFPVNGSKYLFMNNISLRDTQATYNKPLYDYIKEKLKNNENSIYYFNQNFNVSIDNLDTIIPQRLYITFREHPSLVTFDTKITKLNLIDYFDKAEREQWLTSQIETSLGSYESSDKDLGFFNGPFYAINNSYRDYFYDIIDKGLYK